MFTVMAIYQSPVVPIGTTWLSKVGFGIFGSMKMLLNCYYFSLRNGVEPRQVL